MTGGYREVNCDGLVGPTHNYAGLSPGNLASQESSQSVSHPRDGALQGLAKMRLLMQLGVPQIVLPPQERPDFQLLRGAGFDGDDAVVIESAWKHAPRLLAAAYSASGMWAANAATICPSVDAADGRTHFVPANLLSETHRSIEARQTAAILQRIFCNDDRFAHHQPLPASVQFRDEGAANHSRLCQRYSGPGVHLFVYGEAAEQRDGVRPSKHPARQTFEASQAVGRLFGIQDDSAIFAQQHPAAIDAGVFHNDVAAVADRNLLLVHEQAWLDQPVMIDQLRRQFEAICGGGLCVVELPAQMISLDEAVTSYLFNSQVVQLPDDAGTALICPEQCRQSDRVAACVEMITQRAGLRQVHYVDLNQSMRNGGGPACLRLRVVLSEEELAAVHQGGRPGGLLTDALYDELVQWVNRHYRETLHADDLRDPELIDESRTALDDLTTVLGLGALYPFQR